MAFGGEEGVVFTQNVFPELRKEEFATVLLSPQYGQRVSAATLSSARSKLTKDKTKKRM